MSVQEGIRIVSARDDGGDWVTSGATRYQALYFGEDNNPDSPVAVFVKAPGDVGDRVAGLRTHPTPTMIAPIDGWIELDGSWLKPGDMQVASAHAPHGDLVIGPDGATFMILFARRSGLLPTFIDKQDQEVFDERLRSDVSEAAKGASQKSFGLLPPRQDYRPRRGVKVLEDDSSDALTLSVDRYRSPGPGIYRTHMDDDELPWGPRLANARSCMLVLGERIDPTAPVVGVINVDPGPGDRLRGRHIHRADAVNLVIEGALYMDGIWLRAGEAKVVAANKEYGDGLAGPQGVKFLEIWSAQSGAEPVFSDETDHAYFEARKREGHLQVRKELASLNSKHER